MDCLKVYLTFPFLSPLPPSPIFLVLFPSCLIPFFQSTVLLQILSIPETSGNTWGWLAARKWRPRVSCLQTFVCLCEGVNVFVNAYVWLCVCCQYVCLISSVYFFIVNMQTCHCLTIIHGVRWIIFRGFLVKRMKTKPFGALVWCITSDAI